MRRLLVGVFLALAACAREPERSTRAPLAMSQARWQRTLSPATCADAALLLPFLEGLVVRSPAEAIPQTGYRDLTLAYPSPLSLPMIGFRCDGVWHAVRATDATVPVRVKLRARGADVRLAFECMGPCALREDQAPDWRALAKEIAPAFVPSTEPAPLASRVRDVHFYVHDWIDTSDAAHPRKTDWDLPSLASALAREKPDTLAFVYGIDPGEADLEGRYLAPPADRVVAELRAAAPNALLYHWLDLRTYKYAVPALGIDRPPDARVRASAKLYATGPNEIAQYAFKALEMCTGDASWQASRLAELDRLIAAGFRVIALDEFPIAPRWDGEPCRATNHLHRAGDAADELRVTLDFVARLADRARRAGVLLGSEEPSAALLPYVSAYMDGTFNDPPDVYDLWMKSALVERVPLFSTMFGDRVTPMTRPAPKTDAPSPWLTMHKRTR